MPIHSNSPTALNSLFLDRWSSHFIQHFSSFQKNPAKIAAVPNVNSPDNQLKSSFQQIQQKSLIDFNQDVTLFYIGIASASGATIYMNMQWGKCVFFRIYMKLNFGKNTSQCVHSDQDFFSPPSIMCNSIFVIMNQAILRTHWDFRPARVSGMCHFQW